MEKQIPITIEPEIYRKFYVAETKQLRNGDVEGFVSTEDVDRVGDVIMASGWELDNYKKSGSPVLFGHEYRMTAGGGIPHIGNAVEMEIQQKGLWSVTRFHEKTQLSRESAVLAREGIMPSWSVGFEPREKPTIRKDEENGDAFLGFVFTKQELLEYSLVPVPANPEATSRAMHLMQKGLISQGIFNVFRESSALYAKPAPQAGGRSGRSGASIREVFAARAVRSLLRARSTQWMK